jgi:cytochrome c oxidase subunit 2
MNLTTLAQSTVETWLFRKTDSTDLVGPTDHIFMLILWISVFSFILLMSLMVYFVVVYRRRPGVAIERSSSHNTPIEIAWTVLPTIALAIMFFDGFWVYIQQAVAPGDAIQMNLSAKKWNWEIQYPKGTVSTEATSEAVMATDSKGRSAFTYPIYYMPANTSVKLKMNSQDVIHSFFVPNVRVKVDTIPGRITRIWWDAKVPGTYGIACAEMCGTHHYKMGATLTVYTEEDFNKWCVKGAINVILLYRFLL